MCEAEANDENLFIKFLKEQSSSKMPCDVVTEKRTKMTKMLTDASSNLMEKKFVEAGKLYEEALRIIRLDEYPDEYNLPEEEILAIEFSLCETVRYINPVLAIIKLQLLIQIYGAIYPGLYYLLCLICIENPHIQNSRLTYEYLKKCEDLIRYNKIWKTLFYPCTSHIMLNTDKNILTNKVNEYLKNMQENNLFMQQEYGSSCDFESLITYGTKKDASNALNKSVQTSMKSLNKNTQTTFKRKSVHTQTKQYDCNLYKILDEQLQAMSKLEELLIYKNLQITSLVKEVEEMKKEISLVEKLKLQFEMRYKKLEAKYNTLLKVIDDQLVYENQSKQKIETLENNLRLEKEKHSQKQVQEAQLNYTKEILKLTKEQKKQQKIYFKAKQHFIELYQNMHASQKETYSQNVVKCNKMVSNLKNVSKYLSASTTPTATECQQQIEGWSYQKQNYEKYICELNQQFDVLLKNITSDSYNSISLICCPDVSKEPVYLMHSETFLKLQNTPKKLSPINITDQSKIILQKAGVSSGSTGDLQNNSIEFKNKKIARKKSVSISLSDFANFQDLTERNVVASKAVKPRWEKTSLSNWHMDESDNLCAICLENFSGSVRSLICKHKFHLNCLRRWISTKSECPVCRIYVVMDEDFPPLKT